MQKTISYLAIQMTSSYAIYLSVTTLMISCTSVIATIDRDITFIINFTGLFNLRAKDFPFDPYFISFCVIDARETDIR